MALLFCCVQYSSLWEFGLFSNFLLLNLLMSISMLISSHFDIKFNLAYSDFVCWFLLYSLCKSKNIISLKYRRMKKKTEIVNLLDELRSEDPKKRLNSVQSLK